MLTVEDRPRGCGGPQLLTKGHGAVEAFPSHETQRLATERAKSQAPRDARCWWTYQRHRGNAGTMVLTHNRAPPARATNPKTGGRLTQAPAGSNPTTGQAAFFFNLVGDLTLWQVGTSLVFEVAGGISSGKPTWCWRSPAGLPQVYLRSVGGRGVLLGVRSRFVVFFFSLFLLSGVSVVRLCCRLARLPLRIVAPETLGNFVAICTFLLFVVFCLVECAVDSDCSCWVIPGRFLHHWRQFHQTGLARGRAEPWEEVPRFSCGTHRMRCRLRESPRTDSQVLDDGTSSCTSPTELMMPMC